jgi:5-methylcytosine-specific restriction enzyme subunit McrC
MLWVSENGRIYRGKASQNRSDGNLDLRDADFNAILTLLDEGSEASPGIDPIFKYSRSYGQDVLTVQQYAGVIRTDTGCQLEILPKISKKTDAESARKLLVKMLIELNDSPFKAGTLADLSAHKMPLFEFLMRQFLEHVGEIVRKGIARTYIDLSDNLIYLRGKLQLTEHIKHNAWLHSRVYCEFDEFEIDRPINRLVRAALGIVERLTQDADNQQRCRELLFCFEGVPPSRDFPRDFREVRQDRLIRHYEPAIPTCRLILERLNPLTRHGTSRAVSMLFPMAAVFEDYVAAKLPNLLDGWRVRTQVRGQALVERHVGGKIFRLIPDIELRRGDQRVIADTKWKLLDESDRRNRYNISQPDIYQLFAYLRKYLAHLDNRRVVLIYPRTETFQGPLEPFWYKEGKEVLYVLPYDLENDQIELHDVLLTH